MVSLILLPPLGSAGLARDTAVLVTHSAGIVSSNLGQALTQYPKSAVALHPVDAPLQTLSLPPLPANRRDAALRVKLEDAVLLDPAQLTLAVQAVGKNTFQVSSVRSTVLTELIDSLSRLGFKQRSIVALAAHLPHNSKQTLGEWTLYRDAQGAGAIPTQASVAQTTATHDSELSLSTDNRFNPVLLIPSSASFSAAQSNRVLWQRWRWAILLATLCGFVYIAGTWLHWRNLLALEKKAQRSIATVFAQAMPNTPMIDPVLQLQQSSAGASASANGTALTQALSQLPSDWSQAAVTQLAWNNKRLSVTVTASVLKLNPAQQTLITDSLAAKNIAVVWSKP